MSIVTDNSEIFNTFRDQLSDDVDKIEPLIFQLVEPGLFHEAVNSLFRIFHNHKALTAFLGFDEMQKSVHKGETVLNIIRQEGVISDEAQVDWLLILSDQMSKWLEELDRGTYDLSPANKKIFSELKLKEEKTSVSATLKTLHLLYLDDQATAPKLVSTFEKIFDKVSYIAQSDSLKNDITQYDPDLIILAPSFINSKTYRALHSHDDIIPTIGLITKESKQTILKLINQGIHYYLTQPLSGRSLKKVFHSIVQSHFSSRKMILCNKKIRSFIDTLDPLGDSIKKIQEICDDPQASIAELIKVVKSDPICSGTILNATKSPIYALKDISSIDQAVSTFGKRTVKALVLGGLSSRFMPANLSMYHIDEEKFLEITHLRMKLMSKWYQRVNPKHVNILTVAALLSNLGQMLISREILKQEKEDAFLKSVTEKSAYEAEYEFLRTSTAAVTSDILYFWKMSSRLIDAISYSDDPMQAVEEIQPLSLACHIVFSLVPLTEPTILPISDDIKKLLLENDLNSSDLLKAIAETLS